LSDEIFISRDHSRHELPQSTRETPQRDGRGGFTPLDAGTTINEASDDGGSR
jgi:hypothetical protein